MQEREDPNPEMELKWSSSSISKKILRSLDPYLEMVVSDYVRNDYDYNARVILKK